MLTEQFIESYRTKFLSNLSLSTYANSTESVAELSRTDDTILDSDILENPEQSSSIHFIPTKFKLVSTRNTKSITEIFNISKLNWENSFEAKSVSATTGLILAFRAGEPLDRQRDCKAGLVWEFKSEKRTTVENKISRLFNYRNYLTVEAYITKNPHLRELLFETYYKILDYFGSDSNLVLEYLADLYEPEFGQLFLYIKSNQAMEKSIALLEKFETEWWFERTGYVINSPIVTLE